MSATKDKPSRKAATLKPEYAAKVEALLATFDLPPAESRLFEYLIDSELDRRGIDPETLKAKK